MCTHVRTHERMHARTHARRQAHIHTYMQTYIHTYVHTYIHTYIPTYLHAYIHTYIQTGSQTDRHTRMHGYMDVCMHVLVHMQVNASACMYVCTHVTHAMYACTCVCMQVCMHVGLKACLNVCVCVRDALYFDSYTLVEARKAKPENTLSATPVSYCTQPDILPRCPLLDAPWIEALHLREIAGWHLEVFFMNLAGTCFPHGVRQQIHSVSYLIKFRHGLGLPAPFRKHAAFRTSRSGSGYSSKLLRTSGSTAEALNLEQPSHLPVVGRRRMYRTSVCARRTATVCNWMPAVGLTVVSRQRSPASSHQGKHSDNTQLQNFLAHWLES